MKKIAFSSLSVKYINEISLLLTENKYVEWDINWTPISLSENRMNNIKSILQKSGEVRFHLPYGFWDIADMDELVWSNTHSYYLRLFSSIRHIGSNTAVLHIGNTLNTNPQLAIKKLTDLALEAKMYNVSLCLENLTHGLSSDMSFLKECMEIENVYFCLDIGHAEYMRRKFGNKIFDDICQIKDKILHAHVYAYEDDNMNHIPFTETSLENNIWFPFLLDTKCDWYTMELDKIQDQIDQKKLIESFLANRGF